MSLATEVKEELLWIEETDSHRGRPVKQELPDEEILRVEDISVETTPNGGGHGAEPPAAAKREPAPGPGQPAALRTTSDSDSPKVSGEPCLPVRRCSLTHSVASSDISLKGPASCAGAAEQPRSTPASSQEHCTQQTTSIQPATTYTEFKLFFCHLCKQRFSQLSELNNHTMIIHEIYRYQAKFKSRESFYYHQREESVQRKIKNQSTSADLHYDDRSLARIDCSAPREIQLKSLIDHPYAAPAPVHFKRIKHKVSAPEDDEMDDPTYIPHDSPRRRKFAKRKRNNRHINQKASTARHRPRFATQTGLTMLSSTGFPRPLCNNDGVEREKPSCKFAKGVTMPAGTARHSGSCAADERASDDDDASTENTPAAIADDVQFIGIKEEPEISHCTISPDDWSLENNQKVSDEMKLGRMDSHGGRPVKQELPDEVILRVEEKTPNGGGRGAEPAELSTTPDSASPKVPGLPSLSDGRCSLTHSVSPGDIHAEGPAGEQEPLEIYKCNICQVDFKNRERFHQHQRKIHIFCKKYSVLRNNKNQSTSGNKASSPAPGQTPHRATSANHDSTEFKLFFCHICEQRFSLLSELNDHKDHKHRPPRRLSTNNTNGRSNRNIFNCDEGNQALAPESRRSCKFRKSKRKAEGAKPSFKLTTGVAMHMGKAHNCRNCAAQTSDVCGLFAAKDHSGTHANHAGVNCIRKRTELADDVEFIGIKEDPEVSDVTKSQADWSLENNPEVSDEIKHENDSDDSEYSNLIIVENHSEDSDLIMLENDRDICDLIKFKNKAEDSCPIKFENFPEESNLTKLESDSEICDLIKLENNPEGSGS